MKKLITLSTLILFTLFAYAQSFEWAKSMGGTDEDWGYSNTVDALGNVYTTGWFTGTVDFDPGASVFNLTAAGDNDAFVSKLDLNGDFLWAKRIGNTSQCRAFSISVDIQDNVYIAGYFQGTVDFDPGTGIYNLTSAGNFDNFIIKLNSAGDFIWAKSFGGPNGEAILSIFLDANCNVYTTGRFSATVDFDPGAGVFNLTSVGNWDIFISKLDSSGNFIWAKSLGGTGHDFGLSIVLDNSDNVLVTGQFQGTVDFNPGAGVFYLTSNGSFDAFIIKLDFSGNFLWAISLGNTGNDAGNSITTDDFGNVYTTGSFNGTVDFDPGSGVYNLSSSAGAGFVLKLDAAGDFQWVNQLGGGGSSITSDITGNIYNVSSGTHINKTDASGNLIWTFQIGGSGQAIALDFVGNIYTAGYFNGTVDMDPGPGIFNLTSAGDKDIFIHKMSQCIPPSLTTTTTNPLCHGGTGSATVTATGNAPFNYSWSNGDSTQAASLPAGTHTVTVTDDSSCVAVATVTITEPTQIVSNITSTLSNFNSPNCNGSVAINPTGGTPPYTVSWSSGTTTNLCEGWYTATITDANNCVMTDSVYVNFVTGIEELNAAGIYVYPNPVNDLITINSDKMEIDEIKIYDVNGKLIKHEFINSKKTEVDVKDLEAGIYFIGIKTHIIKIVKK